MVDLDFITECLLVYKSTLYFDGSEGLRDKLSEQIGLLASAISERDALKDEIEAARKQADKLNALITECTVDGELDSRLFNAYMEYASPVTAQQHEIYGDIPDVTNEELLRLTNLCQRYELVRVPAQQPEEVTPQYPMQPMFLDKGLPRFEKNPIVDWLCEKHGLNEIGIWWQVNNVEQKYIEQLYQLIGYSIRGYEELSEVSDASFDRAHAMAEQLLKGGENER